MSGISWNQSWQNFT